VVRVFIAVDVEDPVIVSRVERLMDALASTGAPLKLVEPHNLHITLRFIGEVEEWLAGEISSRVLSRLSVFDRFRVMLRGVGAFPNTVKPRVVWVGAGEGSQRLVEIRRVLEKELRSLGVRGERDDFVPHLTVARVKGLRNVSQLARIIADYSEEEFGWLSVENVRLKKSTLTPRGPIYETIGEVRLK